jgi:diamine N-acetyltransferase
LTLCHEYGKRRLIKFCNVLNDGICAIISMCVYFCALQSVYFFIQRGAVNSDKNPLIIICTAEVIYKNKRGFEMIRKFIREDKEKYIAMSKAFYASDAVLHNIPEKYIRKTFDEIMSGSPYADGYIIESDGKTAGYSLLAFTYSGEAGGVVLWIEDVYILPEYQGNGYGTELLKFLYNTYKNKVARIRLEVEKENRGAIKLYKKLGFEDLNYSQLYMKTV